jgi:Asp/Glu/hydantoin racemase
MSVLAFIHTVHSLAPVFEALARELLHGINTFHIVDESLLRRTIQEGKLTPETMRRLIDYVGHCERSGADGILVTCSSLGPATDIAKQLTSRSLLRIDEPMVEEALRLGTRVGVLATLPSTLNPTVELIRRLASDRHSAVEVQPYLCEGAFEALRRGEVELHDEGVRTGLHALCGWADVIVLAQASMARVTDQLSSDCPVPVLSSPRIAVERMGALLAPARSQAV